MCGCEVYIKLYAPLRPSSRYTGLRREGDALHTWTNQESKVYIPPGIFVHAGADNAIIFCVGNISNIVCTQICINLFSKFSEIMEQNSKCTSFKNKICMVYRHFICVGLYCQCEGKETPGGI